MSYTIIKNYVDKSKYGIKCPYEMTPKYITVHNTDNDAPAENEVAYMRRNNLQTSFHVAVDDKQVVYGVPLNRNAWHAGDGGNGTGNRMSIGVEICYSKSGGKRFDEAEKNAAKWIAKELNNRGWGIDRVKRHKDWSGKNCPKRTMEKGWDRFLKMVETELKKDDKNKLSKPSKAEYKVKVTTSCLNIRRGPSVKHVIVGCIIDKGVYTIVETNGDWGKLKSGAGWICLKYTKEVK